MRLAQHMAVASKNVRVDCIEAGEFPDLSQRYDVMAVPKVIINERVQFECALAEGEFLKAVLSAVQPAGEPSA